MLNFLKVFDCFPVPLFLKYKKKNYFRTWTGVFWTFVLIGIVFAYFSSLISENPIITRSSLQVENPSFFQIDKLDFPIMVGLNDFDSATFYINESIYKPHAELVVFKKKEDSTDKNIFNYPIPLEPCQFDFLNKTAISDFFLKVKWDSLYCLRNDLVQNISIGGAFDRDLFQFLRIYFEVCHDDDNITCTHQEIIQKSLSRGYASLFFMDYVEDFNDKADPMKPYGRNIFTNFGINYTKGIDINFEETLVETDSGLISGVHSTDRYQLYESSKEFFEPIPTPDRFFYFEFKVGKTKIEYRRKYPKIEEILSKAGGLINILFLICSFILSPFTKLTFYWELLNECFDLKVGRNLVNVTGESSIDFGSEKEKEELKNKNIGFHLKDYFLFYLYSFFPRFRNNIRLKKVYNGTLSIEKAIDIRNIIKKLHEVDKLKLLLLSNEQFSLFNHLPKPKITNESTFVYGNIVYMKKNKDYSDMYEQLKNKEDKTEIDTKLLNMIEKKAENKFSKGSLGGFLAFNGKFKRIKSKKISLQNHKTKK